MKINCSCKHEQQDALHGAGTRVANPTQKRDEKSVQVRCTVCKTLHNVPRGRAK